MAANPSAIASQACTARAFAAAGSDGGAGGAGVAVGLGVGVTIGVAVGMDVAVGTSVAAPASIPVALWAHPVSAAASTAAPAMKRRAIGARARGSCETIGNPIPERA
ncbi:hypothetical protein [Leifsonia xyli]|uniref:hypothetical protein n=1 Tax=Leifsonia xyli TaxID=1575 RepID=UPI003D66B704